jgi:hypothetical protein
MLPIKSDGWDEADPGCINLHNIEFLEDFGTIEKGKKFDYAFIDIENGFFNGLNEGETGIEGGRNEQVEVRFKAIAVE